MKILAMTGDSHFSKTPIPPARMMLAVLLLLLLTQVAAVYTLLQQPWTGLQVEPDSASGFLQVTSVDTHSPAMGHIRPNTVLTQLRVGEESVPLSSQLFMYPFHHPNRAEYDIYQTRQGRIHSLLSSGQPVAFIDNSGMEHVLQPNIVTPIGSIPFYFWIFSIVFSALPIIGVIVWINKPYAHVNIVFFIACISGYEFHFIGAVHFANEFFFSQSIMNDLFILELVSLNIYMLAFFRLSFYYPHQVIGNFGFMVIAGAFLFYSVNFFFSWVSLPTYYLVPQALVQAIISMMIVQQQIKRSRHRPIDMAIVRIILLSLMLPFTLVAILYITPIALGIEPLMSKNLLQTLGAIALSGFAISIPHFRLFEVESWWFKSASWLLGGCMVVLVDITLITLFNTSQYYSLGLSVLLAGFLYFPLRQWLMSKLMPLDSQSVQDFLPTFNTLIGTAVFRDEFEQRWQEVLHKRFQPLHLSVQPQSVPVAVLADNGLHLDVPSLSGINSYRLTGKQMGMRLFGKTNLQTITALLDIARIASTAGEIRQQTVLAERVRIMRDLHDTVGAKLLTLSHTLLTAKHKQAAQDSLQALRETISLTLQTTPLQLDDHLADWRAELMEQAEKQGVKLTWNVDPVMNAYRPSVQQVVSINEFIRSQLKPALMTPDLQALEVCFELCPEGVRSVVQGTVEGQILSLDVCHSHPNG